MNVSDVHQSVNVLVKLHIMAAMGQMSLAARGVIFSPVDFIMSAEL